MMILNRLVFLVGSSLVLVKMIGITKILKFMQLLHQEFEEIGLAIQRWP